MPIIPLLIFRLRRDLMASDFQMPEALQNLGEPLQVHPPKASAGRTGYFTIAAVFVILAGLTILGIVNPPEHNPPPPMVLVIVMSVCGTLAVAMAGKGLYSQN